MKFAIAIWLNKIKSIVKETSVGKSSWIKAHSTFSGFGDYQNSDSELESTVLQKRYLATSWKVWIETLTDEIGQLVMEKWSIWKSSFFKLVAILSHNQSIRILTDLRKPQIYQMINFLHVESFQKTRMELCLFGKKWVATSWKFYNCLSFLGVSSKWEFQNDMFQQIIFRKQSLFANPERLILWRKRIQKKWKQSLFTYLVDQNF